MYICINISYRHHILVSALLCGSIKSRHTCSGRLNRRGSYGIICGELKLGANDYSNNDESLLQSLNLQVLGLTGVISTGSSYRGIKKTAVTM